LKISIGFQVINPERTAKTVASAWNIAADDAFTSSTNFCVRRDFTCSTSLFVYQSSLFDMDAPKEVDGSMMSSLTNNSLRTRPSFGASSSHSTSSQSQLELQGASSASGPRRRTGSDGVSTRQDEKREEVGATAVNDATMIVTLIEEEAPAQELPQLAQLSFPGETTFRESGLSPVHESTTEGYGAGEHPAIANNLSQEVELMTASGLLLDADKEEEDEAYWRRFYIVLSVLVLAGVISAVVVSIVNHTRETRRLVGDA
jgi:hypothetical protein